MEKLLKMRDVFSIIYPSHGPLPIPIEQIEKLIAAAEKLLAGELIPEEAPPQFPGKIYRYEGAMFVY